MNSVKIKILIIIILLFCPFKTKANNTHQLFLDSTNSEYGSYSYDIGDDLNITGDFSLECWIEPDRLPSDSATWFAILSLLDSGNDTVFIWSVAGGDGHDGSRIFYSDGASNYTVSETDDAIFSQANDQYHVALTCDVSTPVCIHYINGVSTSSAMDLTAATSLENTAGTFYVGRYKPGNDKLFDGRFDECRVWNDVRTAQEILDSYNCGTPTDLSNNVCLYPFNNSLNDDSGNFFDLTDNNTVQWDDTNLGFSIDCGGEEPPTSTSTFMQYNQITATTTYTYDGGVMVSSDTTYTLPLNGVIIILFVFLFFRVAFTIVKIKSKR